MKKIFTILFMLIAITGFSQTGQWSFVSYLPAPNPPVNSIYAASASVIWVACDASGGAARVLFINKRWSNMELKKRRFTITK